MKILNGGTLRVVSGVYLAYVMAPKEPTKAIDRLKAAQPNDRAAVTFYLSKSLVAKLKQVCAENGLKISPVIEDLIQAELSDRPPVKSAKIK